MILVYVTHPDEAAAKRIVNHLLERHLIACATLFPVQSFYWWQGRKHEEGEIVTLLKTDEDFWDNLLAEIRRVHPYTTPCVLRVEVDANPEYKDWVKRETRG